MSWNVDAIVLLEKMQCADFVEEVETRDINSNTENTNLHNSDLLFRLENIDLQKKLI